MIALMVYVLLVSCVVAASAILADRALTSFGRPTRGIWLVALLASAAVPVVTVTASRVLEVPAIGSVRSAANSEGRAEPSYVAQEAPTRPSARSGIDWLQWSEWADWSGWQWLAGGASRPFGAVDDALLALWIAGAAGVLLAYAAAWVALRRALRRLPRTRIDGAEVSVSDALGPAVFGLLEPKIIVPKWLLEAPNRVQSSVVRHEQAHAAAKDTWWLAGAMLAVALVPWNPAMWWQLRRLRSAVELDCDARVVRAGADAAAYAGVLVSVARRRASLRRSLPLFAAAASIGPASQLERRVKRLVEPRKANRLVAGALGAGAAAALVAAFALPPPEATQAQTTTAAQADAGREIEHAPLTGLAVGGERIVVLVDVSAGMLDRTAAGIDARRALSPEERRQAPKWRQLVETVESVTQRIPSGARFQVVLFNDRARMALPGTDGQWLTATPALLESSVAVLRSQVAAEGASDLRAAFDAARALQPPADVVHLIVDGLPTARDEREGAPASEREKMQQLDAAIESAPPGAAINVILMPKEGEAIAAPAYWTLTHRTGGAFFAPVAGTMRGPVPGVPLDAEYLIFIVDTSGSMHQFAWDRVRRHILDTLEAHPSVKGFQVMSDQGAYLFESDRGHWLPDTPGRRDATIDAMQEWRAFSTSSPPQGILDAIETFYDPEKRIALYVYGDDFADGTVDEALASVEAANRDAETGRIKMPINAVLMPVYLEVTGGELLSAARYATLMRELTLRYDGAFIALSDL
jgi:beta-lactamase regulating signal transducer with metallopeptidase domain